MGNAASIPVDVVAGDGRGREVGGDVLTGRASGVGSRRRSSQSQSLSNKHQPHRRRRTSSKQQPQPQPQQHGKGPRQNKKNQRPPPELSLQNSFHVISPASDVSNPSNFHLKHHYHNKTRSWQQTPVRERRRRASRVLMNPTQPARTRLHLQDEARIARPEHFYYSESSHLLGLSSSLSSSGGGNDVLAFQQQQMQGPKHHNHQPKQLRQRAKQVFTRCFQEAKVREMEEHQQFVSTESVMQSNNSGNGNGNDKHNNIHINAFTTVTPKPHPSPPQFDFDKPLDPGIPKSVEYSKSVSSQSDHQQQHRNKDHTFASILEEDEFTNADDNDSKKVLGAQELESPVCLLFSDEANMEPNFTVDASQSQGLVDESDYLLLHQSLQLDSPLVKNCKNSQVEQKPQQLQANYTSTAEVQNQQPAAYSTTTTLVNNAEIWLLHVQRIRANYKETITEKRKNSKSSKHLSSNSSKTSEQLQQRQSNESGTLSATTGPDEEFEDKKKLASAAASSSDKIGDTSALTFNKITHQKQDDADAELLRKVVSENVQRQIDAQLQEVRRGNGSKRRSSATSSTITTNATNSTRGRSTERRRNVKASDPLRVPEQKQLQDPTNRQSCANESAYSSSICSQRGRSVEPRDRSSLQDVSEEETDKLSKTKQHTNSVGTYNNARPLERSKGPGHRVDRDFPDQTFGLGVSEDSFVQRNSTIFENKSNKKGASSIKRSASMPPSPGAHKIRAAPFLVKPKRSLSVPPLTRQSLLPTDSFPALLHLAGWELPPPALKAEAQQKQTKIAQQTAPTALPGLLQLTGWKIPHKVPTATGSSTRLSDPFPLRSAPRNIDPTKPLRKSEPFPQTHGHFVTSKERDAAELQSNQFKTQNQGGINRQEKHSIAIQTSPFLSAPQGCPERVAAAALVMSSAEPKCTALSKAPAMTTIAKMLQQTYPLTRVTSDEVDDADDDEERFKTSAGTYMKHAFLAPMSKPSFNPGFLHASPAMSVDTALSTDSQESKAVVSNEASKNAAFLFSSDEGEFGNYIKHAVHNSASFNISTLESLHRVSGLTMSTPKSTYSSSETTFPLFTTESITMPPVPQPAAAVDTDDLFKQPEMLPRPVRSSSNSNSTVTSSMTSISGVDGNAKENGRHVRFTDSTQKREAFRSVSSTNTKPGTVTIPSILTKLSDLTDNNTILQSSRSQESSMSEHTFEAIVEEEEQQAKKDIDGTTPVTVCTQPTVVNVRTRLESIHATPSPIVVCENGGQKQHVPAMTNWYTKCNSQAKDNGVTPCRRQASSSLLSNASSQPQQVTNSPYIRFSEARSKFSGKSSSGTASIKEQPVKRRASPAKLQKQSCGTGVGLVHQRIAAMEAKRMSNKAEATTAVAPSPVKVLLPSTIVNKRVRRATTGHEAIAPRKPTLVSPLFPAAKPEVMTVKEPHILEHATAAKDTLSTSHLKPPSATVATFVSQNALPVNSLQPKMERRESTVSCNTESDVYGEIMHATIIDEESECESENAPSSSVSPSSLCRGNNAEDPSVQAHQPLSSRHEDTSNDGEPTDEHEDEDAFAVLLKCNGDEDESIEEESNDGERHGEEDGYEEGSSDEDETVSTVRQEQAAFMPGVCKYASYRVSFGGGSSSTSSSMSTIRQQRLSFLSSSDSSSSTVIASEQPAVLQFREESLVRPNEQNPPKSVKNSFRMQQPMQRTPMQALKWRAFAMEHQENAKKERQKSGKKSSLAERHPNMVGSGVQ